MVSPGLTGPLSLIDPHLLLLNVGNCEFAAISVCIFMGRLGLVRRSLSALVNWLYDFARHIAANVFARQLYDRIVATPVEDTF